MDPKGAVDSSCKAWIARIWVKEYERGKKAQEVLYYAVTFLVLTLSDMGVWAISVRYYRNGTPDASCICPCVGLALCIISCGGVTKALKQMQVIGPEDSYYLALGLTISLWLIMAGATVAVFCSSAPSRCIAGFGGWLAMLFILATYHLETIHFHPKSCLTSMVVSSCIASIYWGCAAQDPVLLHLLSKLIVWVLSLIPQLVMLIISCVVCVFCTSFGNADRGLKRLLDRARSPRYKHWLKNMKF